MILQLLQDFLLAPTLFSLIYLLLCYIVVYFKPTEVIPWDLWGCGSVAVFTSNTLLYVDITIQLRG